MLGDHTLAGLLWEGFRESRRCSRDNYPESYIAEHVLIYEENSCRHLNPKPQTQSVPARCPFQSLLFDFQNGPARAMRGSNSHRLGLFFDRIVFYPVYNQFKAEIERRLRGVQKYRRSAPSIAPSNASTCSGFGVEGLGSGV